MGNVLDTILREDLKGSRDNQGVISYESINSDGNTIFAESDRSEAGFLLSISYVNGVSTDITFFLEASLDGISYAQMPNTATQITDASGDITWDVIGSNANYVRINWTVVTGSMDIYGQYSAARRH